MGLCEMRPFIFIVFARLCASVSMILQLLGVAFPFRVVNSANQQQQKEKSLGLSEETGVPPSSPQPRLVRLAFWIVCTLAGLFRNRPLASFILRESYFWYLRSSHPHSGSLSLQHTHREVKTDR